ncbi:MAG: hypothetical protein ACRDJU_01700 [Actinomycetota bacterium]
MGALVGAVAAVNWRAIVKQGVRVSLDLRAAGMRSAEDLSDLIHEAQVEATASVRLAEVDGAKSARKRASSSG